MHIKQFHALPIDNQYKNDMLTELARISTIPVPLQRPKNELKKIGRGIGEVSSKNIIQALSMWLVENDIKL